MLLSERRIEWLDQRYHAEQNLYLNVLWCFWRCEPESNRLTLICNPPQGLKALERL